ncbi:MAG: chemotaxis protein CheV [Gammaproteobacteria bacterium]|jgi:two-component system, chemotaxis family, chemotaxis protein CheV|nr:chemotaxis protein CheV [Gammaproteobacteria bacterium]MBT7307285.1 chemotaxis protein CheV [Gammaproteobacteria bacterium]
MSDHSQGFLQNIDNRTQLAGSNRLELLLFTLAGGQQFGINVFKVKEVLNTPEITEISRTHASMIGMIDQRGLTIPILDLSIAIDRAPIEDLGKSNTIITEFNESVQGFVVESVDRIIHLAWEEILPPPNAAGSGHHLTAVTKVDGHLVQILDVEQILAEIITPPEYSGDHGRAPLRSDGKPHRILLVDDSAIARKQALTTIKQLGLEYTIAVNGRDALNLLEGWSAHGELEKNPLAMVISDIEMPELDGYTLTRKIREHPGLRDLYILLHTSLSGMFNEQKGSKVGANRLIPKWHPEELAQAILDRIAEIS